MIPVSTYGDWECPCGQEPPGKGRETTWVQTVVSLRSPRCPFCGGCYRAEYRREPIEAEHEDAA